MLLQYSRNGGLSWSLLQEFLFSNASNVGRYIALEMPLKARSASTRLRWWQPSEHGHFYSPWVIDQVSPSTIGCRDFCLCAEKACGSPSPWGSVEEAQDGHPRGLPEGTQLD